MIVKTHNKAAAMASDGTIMLHMPEISKNSNFFAGIAKINKDYLNELVAPLRSLLKNKTLTFTEKSSPAICKKLNTYIRQNNDLRIVKDDLVSIYASFTSNLDNFINLTKADTKLRRLWEMITKSPTISSDEINRILGRAPIVRSSNSWFSVYLIEIDLAPLSFDTYYTNTYGNSYTFTLSPSLRSYFATHLLGEDAVKPHIVSKLPEDENLIKVDFEQCISSDLAYLSAFGMTDNPLSESKGIIPESKLKSIRNQFQTQNFPDIGRTYPLDRIDLLATAFFVLCRYPKHLPKLDDPGKFATEVIDRLPYMLSGVLFGLFLPAFKGFAKSWAAEAAAPAIANIVKILLLETPDKWTSLSNLRMRYMCCRRPGSQNQSQYTSLFLERDRRKHTLKRKSDTFRYPQLKSENIDWEAEIDFPFVIHWIELLCAVGIVEIAYDRTAAPSDPLEGLRYLRLTPLGRFALGIDKKYKAHAAKELCETDYDDENCILTVTAGNCPFSLFLEKVSVAIGNTRFRITAESILKGCSLRSELEDRIENLSKIIDIDLYPNLKSVVEEALQRTKCVSNVTGSYKPLKINERIPGFVSMLMSDTRIRENCILAENSIIFIKTSFLPEFKYICARNGYIIDTSL